MDGQGEREWGEVEGGAEEIRVSYASEEAFRQAYEDSLAHGALFVATHDEHQPEETVRLVLALDFCGAEAAFESEIVGVVPPEMAGKWVTAGISLQLEESGDALRVRLEELTGVSLMPAYLPEAEERRQAARFPARAGVTIETGGGRYRAETADVSYNGMLALVHGIDLGVGTALEVHLDHPGRATGIELEGKVMNQALCDHGMVAVGVQFLYAMGRVEEVTRFIDDLRGFHHARNLATVSGVLGETPLEALVETFSNVSHAGTLTLSRGEEEGRIVYEGGQILYVATGLVSGAKALGRMFAWRDARFDFRPTVEPLDTPAEPLPLDSALLTASVHRDELQRLDLAALAPDALFALDEGRLCELKDTLERVELEVAEHAGMDFPLGAMLDILTASDAAIYQALVKLVDAGVLSLA